MGKPYAAGSWLKLILVDVLYTIIIVRFGIIEEIPVITVENRNYNCLQPKDNSRTR